VVVWVLLDTCLMEFPLEMDFVSMTDGYSKRNCWDETWKLFDSMSVEGNVEPEEVTMISARSACSQKGGFEIREEFSRICKTRNVNHYVCEMWVLGFCKRDLRYHGS
jgi:pentatricopeptide repeat protein